MSEMGTTYLGRSGLKVSEFVRERLCLGDDVDAIPVKDRVCTRLEYEEASRRIYYRMSYIPATTIKITA